MAPEKLFDNYFADRRITTTRLTRFAVDHLNRMTAAADAFYPALIAALQLLLNQMGIELTGIEGKLRIQAGLTDTTDELMDELEDFMRDHEDELRYKLKGVPGAILQFYPGGNRSVYSNLTKERMPEITGALAAAATSHAALLEPDTLAALQDFVTRWKTASEAQRQAMGAVSQDRADRDALRPQLDRLLMGDVYKIADRHIDNPAKAMALFDFALLWYKGMRNGPGGNTGDDTAGGKSA